jgi:predicted phage tail protein
MSTLDRMRRRASVLRTVYFVLLIVGIVGSVVLGIQAGRSINFSTGILFTSTSQNNGARGLTFFVAGAIVTVITTMPLLGISWIIDGQAKLLAATPKPPGAPTDPPA